MTPYLQRIWTHLVRRHRLRNVSDDDERRVMSRDKCGRRDGGPLNYTVEFTRHVLTYHKKLDYIDYCAQSMLRCVNRGRHIRDKHYSIDNHIAVNAAGTIRRCYYHNDEHSYAVRTISLRNYHLLGDDRLARLIMVTNDDLQWINEIPVAYHPIPSGDLWQITSLNDLYTYITGPGVEIPKRLLHAMPVGELLLLLQVVPGPYLNEMAAIVKQEKEFQKGAVRAARILLKYYKRILEDPKRVHFQTVYCYVNCCRSAGRKLNIRIKSANRFLEERRKCRMRRELDKLPEIETAKQFVLDRTDHGEVKLELIDSRKRLLSEAIVMKTCVADYAIEVINENCGLYHVKYRGHHYTLEIQPDEKGNLYPAQVSGMRNAEAPQRLKSLIGGILKNCGRTS